MPWEKYVSRRAVIAQDERVSFREDSPEVPIGILSHHLKAAVTHRSYDCGFASLR
jgi:hypothetical protein